MHNDRSTKHISKINDKCEKTKPATYPSPGIPKQTANGNNKPREKK